TSLLQRLRLALPVAMKARDQTAVAALRSALSAVDNAGAVERSADADRSPAIERIPIGLAATESARRVLTDADVVRIVQSEIADREAAAIDDDHGGRVGRADRLRAEAAVLSEHLAHRADGEHPESGRLRRELGEKGRAT